MIESSKTFGMVSLRWREELNNQAGVVGTTAEIFHYQEEDGEAAGLKIKARGRQRFRIISARRQVDGNLVGEVRMLVDRELPEPLSMLRLKSWDRLASFPDNSGSDAGVSGARPAVHASGRSLVSGRRRDRLSAPG